MRQRAVAVRELDTSSDWACLDVPLLLFIQTLDKVLQAVQAAQAAQTGQMLQQAAAAGGAGGMVHETALISRWAGAVQCAGLACCLM